MLFPIHSPLGRHRLADENTTWSDMSCSELWEDETDSLIANDRQNPIVQKLHLFSTLFVLLSKQLFVEASSFGTDASCALSTDQMSLKVCPPSWPPHVEGKKS